MAELIIKIIYVIADEKPDNEEEEEEIIKPDKEEETLYVGTQVEFCLLVVQVCKEVLQLCDIPGISNTYCCRSKAFYWPLFKNV